MKEPRTSAKDLCEALRILAGQCNSMDGVPEAVLCEAACRIEEYHQALEDIIKHNETILGGIVHISSTYIIAKKAIDGE